MDDVLGVLRRWFGVVVVVVVIDMLCVRLGCRFCGRRRAVRLAAQAGAVTEGLRLKTFDGTL